MATRVRIQGTDELRIVAVKLREAGRKDVLNALRRGIRDATKDAVADVQDAVRGLNIDGVATPERLRVRKGTRRATGTSATGRAVRLRYDVMRSRGNAGRVLKRATGRAGLRETVARSITTQISAGARSASVRIKVDRKRMPEDQQSLPRWLNKGKWRHPTFGNTSRWVDQRSSPAGWFDNTLRRHRDRVRAKINLQVGAAMDRVRS